jgi:ElaB/YqjD/DUF883 family membrane-anchored ribosome-binding protein
MGDITDAAHKLTAEGGESVRRKRRISPAVSKAEIDLRETMDRTRLKSLQLSDRLNDYVQESSFRSLGIAFAIGIIACSFFRRRQQIT